MNTLFLLVRIAGERVAFPAGDVVSVVELGAITPVPLAPGHVVGLAPLRSRTLTVVDSQIALGVIRPADCAAACEAVVVKIDDHLYGLAVDRVDDIVSVEEPPRPVRIRLAAGWARAARGMIDHDGNSILLLDPAAIVAGPVGLAA